MTKPSTFAPSSWGCPATLAGDRDMAAYLGAHAPVAAPTGTPVRRLILEATLAVALGFWAVSAPAVSAAAVSAPAVSATAVSPATVGAHAERERVIQTVVSDAAAAAKMYAERAASR